NASSDAAIVVEFPECSKQRNQQRFAFRLRRLKAKTIFSLIEPRLSAMLRSARSWKHLCSEFRWPGRNIPARQKKRRRLQQESRRQEHSFSGPSFCRRVPRRKFWCGLV